MVDVLGFFRGKREAAKPKAMQGASGFVVTGGYIQSNEINTKLQGQTRWKTASDLLTNISIIAAGVRYSLNLIARPAWSFEPAIENSAEAREMAEFAQSVLDGVEGTWTAVVRRMALYRWHGFGLHEWQAVERPEDGKIGIGKIAVRPCHTVERWDIEPDGTIKGVWQKRPIDGKEIYLPRAKTLYLVDDSLTDNPEGMGWFRHLVEPASRLRRLLEIETMGFERDLNGIPVGRAPIAEINAMVGTVPQGWTKTFTQEDANAAIAGITSFVRMEAKKPGTGVLLDSQPYASQSADGESLTGEKMWDIDLLTSDPNGLDSIAKAVERLEYEMSLVMGTDSMLTGRGGEGSRALSQDKSHNLYLLAESTISDIKEVVDRDFLGPVWALNGLPEELKPKAKTESINFKDAAHIAQVLKDMATAGAVLAPDDPAIDDLRGLLDLPPQPELTDEERGILMGTKPSADAQLGAEAKDKDREAQQQAANDEEPPGGPPNPKEGRGQAQKYDPNQPRVPAGHQGGGRWTDGSASVLFEVAPNPDNKQLLERWNALSDQEREAITEELAGEFAPQIMEALGVKGQVEEAVGGFEGQINPSLVLTVEGKAFETAGAIGDAFQQKAMVVMSDRPQTGLSPVGMVAVVVPEGSVGKLRSIQDGVGDLADGWTYHNGRMQFLNFSGQSDEDFATEIDKRLGGSYRVEHSTIYSSYIEEADYVRPQSDAKGNAWGQVSGNVREAFSQRLEEKLGGGKTGKALLGAWFLKYDPDQPRDPKGSPTGGQWTAAGGGTANDNEVVPLTKDAKREFLVEPNRGKSLEQMREEAFENQERLRGIASIIEERAEVEFEEPPKGYEVKSVDSLQRKLRDEGYAGPHEITDYSRASFIVDSPEEADDVVAALAEHGRIYDKGWKYLDEYGYLDRKVYMVHPNDGVSEIQITPRGVYQYKMGQGHQLYEIARKRETPYSIARTAARKSRRVFNRLIRDEGFEGLGK